MFLSVFLGLVFMAGTAAIVIATYHAARRLIGTSEDGIAGNVVMRIAALHGLILALVFAQLLIEYRDLSQETIVEADAVADIYNDLRRHGAPEALALQASVTGYIAAVVETEWQSLAREKRLTAQAWAHWGTLYDGILDLAVDTPRRASLRAHMLADVGRISEVRDRRAAHTDGRVLGMFWVAALAGVVMVAAGYHGFAPDRATYTMLGLFGAYTGLILFLIHAFSNPYAAPGALEPSALIRLQAQLQ